MEATSSRPSSPASVGRRPQSAASILNTHHLFQVFLRLRPPHSSSQGVQFLSTIPGQSHVYVTPPEKNRFRVIEKFSFTEIFGPESTQRDIFEGTVLPLLQDTVKGRDTLLATLGVTGSGKTHTILGNHEQRGMTQLSLDVLFRSIGDQMVDFEKLDMAASDHSEAMVMDAPTFCDKMSIVMDTHIKRASHVSMPKQPPIEDITVELDKRSRYAVLISMYEVYNDRMYDLLDETSFLQPQARKKALVFKKCNNWDRNDKNKKVVAGLRKVYVKNLAEAIQILEHGQACRHASPTNSNHRSSRSHAFFCIEIKRVTKNNWDKIQTSTFQVVDLAGSERARQAKTTGDRLAEAGSINRSLMCLGQCLQLQTQLENGKPAIVPYRQSKLTELLFSNSFTGTASQKAAMIVTADPLGDFNSTFQILRYSALARDTMVPKTMSRTPSGASEMSLISAHEEIGALESSPNAALITRLLAQIEETEARWRDAEDRCLLIEQQIREEVAEEMEERFRQMNGIYMDKLLEEEEAKNEHMDRKLDLIAQNLEIHEDGTTETSERIDELEEENERLRNEILALKRQLKNQSSPTKTRVRSKIFKSKPVMLDSDTENNLLATPVSVR